MSQLRPSSDQTGYVIITDAFDVVSGHLVIRREADARLIGAAPEMLEALESCLGMLEYLQGGERDEDYMVTEHIESIGKLIAKARGHHA